MVKKAELKSRSKAGQPVYVVDTHAFYWYLQNPERLSPAADAVFRLAEAGAAKIVVPAIVLAELFYVAKKQSYPLALIDLLAELDRAANFVISDMGRPQIEKFADLDIAEMHDRLIAADALVHEAIVVTKDDELKKSAVVTTLW